MSQNSFEASVPNVIRFSPTKVPLLLAALLPVFIGACAPLAQPPVEVETIKTPEPTVPEYSAEAIVPAKTIDVRFAQEALSKLGYRIGTVDGLWGPRSATAIREFEAKMSLTSANGHLSELNLHELEIASGLTREGYGTLHINSPTGINAKLNRTIALADGPQLIIVDHEYKVLSKPNPYSSVLLTLAPGTGIYVISKQDGYFEIESINRKRGYIKID